MKQRLQVLHGSLSWHCLQCIPQNGCLINICSMNIQCSTIYILPLTMENMVPGFQFMPRKWIASLYSNQFIPKIHSIKITGHFLSDIYYRHLLLAWWHKVNKRNMVFSFKELQFQITEPWTISSGMAQFFSAPIKLILSERTCSSLTVERTTPDALKSSSLIMSSLALKRASPSPQMFSNIPQSLH